MSEAPIPSDPIFRVSGGMKVVLLVLVVPLVLFVAGGSVWLVFFAHLKISDSALISTFGVVFAAGIGGLSWTALRTGIEVLPAGFRFTRGFGPEEEIPFGGIAGYRSFKRKGTATLIIVSKEPGHKPLMIGQYLERRGELENFVKEKFVDLDEADKEADMAEALSDARLGSTTEERSTAISQAKTHALIINAVAAAAMFWSFLYPHPYALLIGVLAAMPLLAVAFVVASHGAISLYTVKNSARPSATLAVVLPAAGLALRSLKDWHILGWSGFWVPFAVLAAIMVAILWLGSMSDAHTTFFKMLGLSIALLAESFGLELFVNCYLDHSVPEIHATRVTSHRIRQGKSNTYYVTVRPWINGRGAKQIVVDRSFYESHSEGSTVLIGVRQGVLQMPWFFVQ